MAVDPSELSAISDALNNKSDYIVFDARNYGLTTGNIISIVKSLWSTTINKTGQYRIVTSGSTYYCIVYYHSSLYGEVIVCSYDSTRIPNDTNNFSYPGPVYLRIHNGSWAAPRGNANFTVGDSSTSFKEAANSTDPVNLPAILDNLNISSYNSGMQFLTLNNNGGPAYHGILAKQSDNYWSYTELGYSNALVFTKFTYHNGNRYVLYITV